MKRKADIRVSYAQTVIGKEELNATIAVLKNPSKIVAGYAVKEFETKIAKLFGKQYGIMVNSGSSANLIAVESLNLPVGSEVITPLLTFSTTIAPLVQKRLVPVFADVNLDTYVIDANQVESLITSKTRALMIPNLLGNIPNLTKLSKIAKKYKLQFIEDSCDTLGAEFENKPTGHYTDISTTSFYASHIITAAGMGGMVCYHNPTLAKKAQIMSNWGRDSTLFGVYEKSEEIKKRFTGILDGDPYDAKFLFSEIGYNFQPTELNGAFGLEQLKKFPLFKKTRLKNFSILYKFFEQFEEYFYLPNQASNVKTAWLAFPLLIKKTAPFTRLEITTYLEKSNIQTRPIFTGNILKQPGFKHIKSKTSKNISYENTEYVMKNGFLIGCHQGLNESMLSYLMETFRDFLKK